MSFNYGKEERKWRLWKEAEEKRLRSLGISENRYSNAFAFRGVEDKLRCFYIGRIPLPKSR